MKKFKKLIPAFCAMLVSAAMLGTSTYAWFSVNKEVTATDMSVTARANTQYFVVKDSLTGGAFSSDSGADNISVKLTTPAVGGIKNGDAETATMNVYPAAYTAENLYLASDKAQQTVKVAGNNWYTGGVSADAQISDENSKFSTLTSLGADEYTTLSTSRNYFVGYKFYVGLADNTDSCEQKLEFTATTVTDTNAAKVAGIAVKHSSASDYDYVSYATTNAGTAVKTAKAYKFEAKNDTLNKTATYVEVIVFVYIDGTNTEVMSKNLKTGGSAEMLKGKIGVHVAAVDA